MKHITYYNHNIITAQEQIKPEMSNDTFLDLIRKHGITGFDAPCGGNGTCGKCRIKIISGEVTPPAENELRLLTQGEIEFGIRLACSCSPKGDVTIDLSAHDGKSAVIASSTIGITAEQTTAPRCTKIALEDLPESSLQDQRSILTKVLIPGEPKMYQIPHVLLQTISQEALSHTAIVLRDGIPCRLVDENSSLYGIAVDIGTTTIVLYLVNLETGEVLDTFSALNAQKSFGADVISRIAYATASQNNRVHLQKVIVKQIEQGILQLIQSHAINVNELIHTAIAGNTTMLHLLIGADTAGIAVSPFIPVFTDALSFSAQELGFSALPDIQVELLPSVAAYVGADITAGIHVSGIHRSEAPAILLDIGTNGEMALSVGEEILCCSTAAGPAFEGANITCGTGGIYGAIDTVLITDTILHYTTIADKPPIGICGSGIIDVVAQLLEKGLIDYTGRLLGPKETDHPCIKEIDGNPVVLLVEKEHTGIREDIILTQKDIREVQLAKSAIAAGLKTLMLDAEVTEKEIDHLYLAGGFGSFIHPKSAGIIGLIPKELVDKTIAIGNSSGEGAVRYCFGSDYLQDILHIAKKCKYIELSAHKRFQDLYIQEMLFDVEE